MLVSHAPPGSLHSAPQSNIKEHRAK